MKEARSRWPPPTRGGGSPRRPRPPPKFPDRATGSSAEPPGLTAPLDGGCTRRPPALPITLVALGKEASMSDHLPDEVAHILSTLQDLIHVVTSPVLKVCLQEAHA